MRKGLYEEASMSGGVPGTQILRTYGLPACVYTELTNMLAKKKILKPTDAIRQSCYLTKWEGLWSCKKQPKDTALTEM